MNFALVLRQVSSLTRICLVSSPVFMASATPSKLSLSPLDEEQNREQQHMEAEMLQNIYGSGEIAMLTPGSEYRVGVQTYPLWH